MDRRCWGSGKQHCVISSQAASLIITTSRAGNSCPSLHARSSSSLLMSKYGGSPVSAWYTVIPNEYTSDAELGTRPWTHSGANQRMASEISIPAASAVPATLLVVFLLAYEMHEHRRSSGAPSVPASRTTTEPAPPEPGLPCEPASKKSRCRPALVAGCGSAGATSSFHSRVSRAVSPRAAVCRAVVPLDVASTLSSQI